MKKYLFLWIVSIITAAIYLYLNTFESEDLMYSFMWIGFCTMTLILFYVEERNRLLIPESFKKKLQ